MLKDELGSRAEALEQGLRDKAQEFVAGGAEIYRRA